MILWSDKNIYDRMIDRFTQRKQVYDRFKPDRDAMAEYFRLDLDIEVDERTNQLILGREIYEGTGPWAARVMATGFQGKLMSKSIDWIMYEMGQQELQGIDELDIWCQKIKEYMATSYQQGNFYDVQPNFTLDGITIGSPVMFCEEDISTSRIMWIPEHYNQCYVFYDKYNQPEGIIVKDETWTAKKIDDEFCEGNSQEQRQQDRNTKLSVGLAKQLENGNFYEKYTVYRAVFKATDLLWDNPDFKKPIGNPRWISIYFEEGCKQDRKNEPLRTDPYYNKPFVVWDYNKKPWHASSSTPAFEAYHDVKSQQQVHKNFLENIQNKTRGAVVHLNTMTNRLDLGPEGLMAVDVAEYDRPPKRIETLGDILLDEKLSAMLGEAVKRHFHHDQLLTFMKRLQDGRAPLNNLETMKLDAESASFLSPFIESHSRYLADCDEVAMGFEIMSGRGPFAPDVMANITDVIMSNITRPLDKITVRPVFIGPLHKMQKISQQIEPIRTGVAIVAEMAAELGDPDMASLMIKQYKTADKALEAVNFPQDCVNTEEDYNQAKAALTQQRMEAEQAKMAIETMKASKNIQGPVDKDSIMAGMAK